MAALLRPINFFKTRSPPFVRRPHDPVVSVILKLPAEEGGKMDARKDLLRSSDQIIENHGFRTGLPGEPDSTGVYRV
jgi:hypothetical protein